MIFPIIFRVADDPSKQIIIGSDLHPVFPRSGETVKATFGERDQTAYRVRSVEHTIHGDGQSSSILVLLDRI